MNCKSCRWWKANDPKNWWIPVVGPDLEGRVGECRLIDSGQPDWSGGRRMVATCMTESINGELYTRDDFGCVHHEAKA